MSIFQRIAQLFSRSGKQEAFFDIGMQRQIGGTEGKYAALPQKISPAKFDTSRVAKSVKTEIRNNVERIEGLAPQYFDQIYDASLQSLIAGRNPKLLFKAIMAMKIDGMTKQKAQQISLSLNNKATAVITREHQEALEIKRAVWRHSGASCALNPKKLTMQDRARNILHKAANGKIYNVSEGMLLDGKWTWPGADDGCQCVSISIIQESDEQ